jgi:hypothetical protein
MEPTMNETNKNLAKPKVKLRTDSLRVRKETKKKILGELATLNKKNFGRPITPDDYVALAISLMQSEHLTQLKEASLSNRDRFDQRYREYCSEKGKISKDEFIGILLAAGK